MRKVKCLIVLCLCFILMGCQNKKSEEDIIAEYLMYSSMQERYRSYKPEENLLIDETIIEEISERKDVEIFPIQYTYYFYNNQLLEDRSWQVKINGELVYDNVQDSLQDVRYYSNYYAMVPYIREETPKKYLTHTYVGEKIEENSIPVYLSNKFIQAFHLGIDNQFLDKIVWTTNTLVPVAYENGKYKMKEITLNLQIMGFADTYGFSSSDYIYTSNEAMNMLIDQNKETELPNYNYAVLMNEATKKKLEGKYANLIILKRTSDEPKTKEVVKGLCEEGCE